MSTKTLLIGSPEIDKSSTLANAAKISHIVNETTIGAFSGPHSKVETLVESTNVNNMQRQTSKDPWRRDVWHTVNLEMEKKRNCGTTISLVDCITIQNKMALKTAERMRQKQVRAEMQERHNKLAELEQMMENMRIKNHEKSATKLQKNLLLKEEQILQLVQQIEMNSQLAEEQAKREMEEHNKKMAEKISRLKRVEEVRGYFQSIKSLKDLFILLFEKFVKTCITNQQHLKSQYTDAREGFLTRYEALIKLVNAGQLSSAEVDILESICDEIKEMQRVVDEEVLAAQELERTIADRNEQLRLEQDKQLQQQQLQQQQEQQQRQQQEQQQQQPEQRSSANVDTTDKPNPMAGCGRVEYQTTMHFYEQYAESVKPLQNDARMKKFRFECIKCVNILSNSISSVSPTHLQGKYDRFALILSGNSVEIGGTRVTPSEHPLGIRFVNLLVAKMFVKQADASMAVLNPTAGFPIASLIVALWQKFPDFGQLFLAYLYKQTTFLVPYHVQQTEGQSVQDYFKSMGFVFTDNICEEQSSFLKRLTGLVRLYAAVIIAKTRRTSNKPHPHGIEFGWMWLTHAMNLTPIADISATMLYEFIVIAGADLWANYNRQFVKLLNLIPQYMSILNEIETGGPKTRLEGLIRKIIQERRIDPPADALPENFW